MSFTGPISGSGFRVISVQRQGTFYHDLSVILIAENERSIHTSQNYALKIMDLTAGWFLDGPMVFDGFGSHDARARVTEIRVGLRL